MPRGAASYDIDDRTRVPLFYVMGAIPLVFGGVLWLASVESKATAAREEIKSARDDLEKIKGMVIDVRESVIRIEEDLKHK